MDFLLSQELEMALLSAIIKDENLIYEAMQYLNSGMFSSEVHGIIFGAMCNIGKRGTHPSRLLIKSELIRVDVFDKVGGDVYLNELERRQSDPQAFREYMTSIENAYQARELIALSQSIPKALEHTPSTAVISRVSKKLENLSTIGAGKDVILLSEILDATYEKIEERTKNPGIQGITTGFNVVDIITTGYGKGELWYIGARPSVGKTSLLIKSLLKVAETGVAVLLINREMNVTNINERIYSMISRVPYQNIRTGILDEQHLKDIRKARDYLATLPFYIDNRWFGDELYVLSSIRKYHQVADLKIVGIDYIQLIVERDAESTHALGRFSKNLKLLAGELDLTIVVLSQLNRDVESRTGDKRPLMSDLRQSGNLEEDADYMVALYRDEMYRANSPDAGKIEFIIRKARNGPIGSYRLNFDGTTVNVTDEADTMSVVEWSKQ